MSDIIGQFCAGVIIVGGAFAFVAFILFLVLTLLKLMLKVWHD